MWSVMDLGTWGHYSSCLDGSVAPASLWGEEGQPEAQKPSCGGIGLVAQGRERHPKGEEIRGSDKPIPENRSQRTVVSLCLREEGPLPWFT